MNSIIDNSRETARQLADTVRAHRFVEGLRPDHLKSLVAAAMFKQFERDEVVFCEGEPANRFYLICQGRIALESRRNSDSAPSVQYLGAGEVLGWSWLFPPYYWHFGARAAEATNAVFFYGTRLRQHCDDDPAFGYEIMKRVAAIVISRLQIVRLQLLEARLQLDHPPLDA